MNQAQRQTLKRGLRVALLERIALQRLTFRLVGLVISDEEMLNEVELGILNARTYVYPTQEVQERQSIALEIVRELRTK